MAKFRNECSVTIASIDTEIHVFFAVINSSSADPEKGSNQTFSPLNWDVLTTFSLFYFIAGVSLNGLVLLIFALDKSLQTPFCVYLINLLLANLIYTLIETPGDIISGLYGTWFMGDSYCTLYNYASLAIQGGTCNSHALITLNRLWAMTHPLSYRNHHSKRLAVSFCVGMWVYVHIVVLPALINDTLYYRKPVASNGCTFNARAQLAWMFSYMTLILAVAEAIVVTAFPFIWYKRHQRSKIRQHHLAKAETLKMSEKPLDPEDDHDPEVGTNGHSRTASQMGNSGVGKQEQRKTVGRENSSAFIVLTLMTFGVLGSWTPYLAMLYWSMFTAKTPLLFFQVTQVMFSLEVVLDPILFTIAMEDIKRALIKVFVEKCCSNRKR